MENCSLDTAMKYAAIGTTAITFGALIGSLANSSLRGLPLLNSPFLETYSLAGMASLITLTGWHCTRPQKETSAMQKGLIVFGAGLAAVWFAGCAYNLHQARHLDGWSRLVAGLVPFITVAVPVTGLVLTHLGRSRRESQ